MKEWLMLVALAALVGCLVGYLPVAVQKVVDPCAVVAARVGYPNAITQEDGDFCRIYIGQDEDGNDTWAWAKK